MILREEEFDCWSFGEQLVLRCFFKNDVVKYVLNGVIVGFFGGRGKSMFKKRI